LKLSSEWRKDIYGGTYTLVTSMFEKFGLEFTLLSDTSLVSYKNAVKKNTKLLFIETPSNPLLTITDIRGVVAIGKFNFYNLMCASPFNDKKCIVVL
jgi:cystathionine beta-lyase